jgi:uncharacterized protein (TIGR04255 family)
LRAILSSEGLTLPVKETISAPHAISEDDLREIFPRPAVKEVAFEIRFAPRFRIKEELWRFQDQIANDYPNVSEENFLQPDGRIVTANVFTNSIAQSVIKVSQENFVFAATKYATYESFKAEALRRTKDFSSTFEIGSFQRIGLRYINHIELTSETPFPLLQRYVNVPVRFDRFDTGKITQLLSEFRIRFETHQMTVRGALLQIPIPMRTYVYVLDLDCYAEGRTVSTLQEVVDGFHHAIQVQFLQHVTEEYKQIMRAKS